MMPICDSDDIIFFQWLCPALAELKTELTSKVLLNI